MTRGKLIAAGLAPLAVLALAGCESTQDKAKKIQDQAEASVETGISVGKPNPDAKVLNATVLKDEFGAAVVVQIKNTSNKTLVNPPILIEVFDVKKASLFRNDIPGLDDTLTHVPLIPAGETITWVNDQILTSGKPQSVKATVGEPEAPPPAGKLPQIKVSDPGPVSVDELSGINVEGKVTNQSQIDQGKVVVWGVARQGNRIVAAGRSVIKILKTTKPANYRIFFIGDPKGAKLEVGSYPTTFQ